MSFVEHNNRSIANKYAEYITGKELRQYVAEKVDKYVGKNISVFDGTIGSGQLEQYILLDKIYGVEIQKESCKALMKNYKNVVIENISFFNYFSDIKCDCVVMNPPFSLKLKDLTDEEINNIKSDFDWKKSGVVDDIFILKSLRFSKRYAFYICFPGIAYRRTEIKMRELIGNQLLELNVIKSAFEDTTIDVLFLVIDKQKNDKKVRREIFDCKTSSIVFQDVTEIDYTQWETPKIIEKKPEINIFLVEREIKKMQSRRRKSEDELDRFIRKTFYENDLGENTQERLFA